MNCELKDVTYVLTDGGADSIAIPVTGAAAPEREAVDTVAVVETPWLQGLQPQALPGAHTSGGDVSWIAVVLIAAVALMAARGRTMAHTLRAMWQASLGGVPTREVYGDEHISDPVAQLALWPLCIVACALGLGAVMRTPTATSIGWLALVTGGYYAVTWVAYIVGAWTFAQREGAGAWLRGLVSTQCLAALTMAPAVLVILFYPAAGIWLGWTALGLWALWRMLFIIKGFKIFYSGIFTLLYFILYLCTLEIAPLVVVYGISDTLVH